MKTTKQKYTVDTQLEIKEHKHTTEENNESTREKAKKKKSETLQKQPDNKF